MNRARRFAKPIVVAGLVAAAASCIAASSDPAAVTAASLPQAVYGPYFETWTADTLANTATVSGAHYFTMAFIQTAHTGSCTPLWDGNPRQPVSAASYGSDINKLRSMGGNVIISFGGSAADESGTEIADSCSSISQIAAAYESVIRTYGVTRLDMDVEGRSLADSAGINRRNRALKLAETWAAQHSISLQVQYTLPVVKSGLPSKCLAVLQNAVADGTRVDVVNVMAFDYYYPDRATVNMGPAAVSALQALHAQLSRLHRTVSSAKIWRMEGVTLLPGIDSAPGMAEITYLSDATQVLNFSRANHISFVSIWAAQRDNGNCPGVADSNWCSGLRQNPWAFNRLLEPFTNLSRPRVFPPLPRAATARTGSAAQICLRPSVAAVTG